MAASTLQIVCPHCNAINRVLSERLGDGAKCGSCKQALFSGHPVALGEDNFDRHINASGIPVVVDFWASWCGPCRMMAPVYEEAAAKLEPHVRLAKVNTEEAQQLAARYNIRSIPTIALFRDGREVSRQAGAMDLGNLLNWVRAQT